jgi:hypothetical protein
MPAERSAGDWQPLIQSNMKRSGAKRPGCPPINRTIGMVSSAVGYQILLEPSYSVKSKQKTNTRSLDLLGNWNLMKPSSQPGASLRLSDHTL